MCWEPRAIVTYVILLPPDGTFIAIVLSSFPFSVALDFDPGGRLGELKIGVWFVVSKFRFGGGFFCWSSISRRRDLVEKVPVFVVMPRAFCSPVM
jgi:hypothetical protein